MWLLLLLFAPAALPVSKSFRLEEPLTVMVVGGFANGTRVADVEVVVIEGDGDCLKPADFPLRAEGAVGMITASGEAMVCGGITVANEVTSDCYVFKAASGWILSGQRLSTPRRFSAAVANAGANAWCIVGGSNDNDGLLATSEVLQGDSFSAGPNLPEAMDDACVTRINATHYFVAGGRSLAGSFSNSAFVYDAAADSWLLVPKMPQGRTGAFCGVFGADGDAVVVVAGGYIEGWTAVNTSVFFHLSKLFWSGGPHLPRAVAFGQSVAAVSGAEDAFYLLGGISKDGDVADVVKFSGVDRRFTRLPQKLVTGRSGFAVVAPAHCHPRVPFY